MKQTDLDYLKNWFSDYCRSFYSSDAEDQKNILLKEKHTHNVCRNIIQIAGEQSLNLNNIMLAETIALFHDLGRFPQYAKYKTFRDSTSVNHGKLGAEILQNENILKNLSDEEQAIIINSIKFHNAFAIPDLKNHETNTSRKHRDTKSKENYPSPIPLPQGEGARGRVEDVFSDEIIFFLKLIRDADKLDIWRVFIEYYEGSEEERASAAILGLSDTPYYSEEVLSCIYKGKMVTLVLLKTLNDFKLLQLSWIFDLNFKTSFRLLLERDYIKKIILTLPQTDEIKKAALILHKYVEQRLNTDS